MVILEYSETNHNFVAWTPLGLVPAIHFQNRYFVIQKAFRRLQEAVKDCRAQVENGFISLVVQYGDRAEVWSQVADHVRVQTQPQPAPQLKPRSVSFRGQKASLTGSAKKRSQPVCFRGQQSDLIGDTHKPILLPETFFYRGQMVSGSLVRS
ncbi:MAG: hypothetical protein HC921_02395 [Synechococcaceae cyanobacterium SM2_3_1]|nr:hypothetical protein [Synechococcaceae cyanobacterium SM2_3_1]